MRPNDLRTHTWSTVYFTSGSYENNYGFRQGARNSGGKCVEKLAMLRQEWANINS